MLLLQLIAALFFIVLTLSTYFISKESNTKKAIKIIWIGVVSLIIFFVGLNLCVSKIILGKDDFYGEYVIDRDFFFLEKMQIGNTLILDLK